MEPEDLLPCLHKSSTSSSFFQTIALLISIRKLLGSHLGRNDYPDGDFSWFSLAPPQVNFAKFLLTNVWHVGDVTLRPGVQRQLVGPDIPHGASPGTL
jgi:hypothetical protein